MKRNAIVRIVLFSITILILLAILVAGLFYGGRLSRLFHRSESTVETLIPEPITAAGETGAPTSADTNTAVAAQIRDIEIEWVSGTITIQPGDVDAVTFSESGVTDEKYAMVWKQSESKLSIDFCQDDFNFGITINSALQKDLFITVPQDWQGGSLEIDAADATLEVRDLTIREVEIDSASGTCYFDNCTVDTLDLDTASGDVEFNGSLNILECDAASANFTAVLTNVPSRMDMDLMSGDLDVTLPENCGFTAAIDGMSSDFQSDFETINQNGRHVHGDGSCRINVSAMSGSVCIRKGAAASASGTLHTHTEECTTNPGSCPDASTEHHEEDSVHH